MSVQPGAAAVPPMPIRRKRSPAVAIRPDGLRVCAEFLSHPYRHGVLQVLQVRLPQLDDVVEGARFSIKRFGERVESAQARLTSSTNSPSE